MGIIGRLGGIGARPERVGIVSDADGATAVLSCALKLADMSSKGDVLNGDIIIATHICPSAPAKPHEPVPFMDSPVNMQEMNKWEVDAEMDAILSLDATKGNRSINDIEIASSISIVSCNPAETTVPGCATGACHETDIEEACVFFL